jgi:hypothetical protein
MKKARSSSDVRANPFSEMSEDKANMLLEKNYDVMTSSRRSALAV